MRDHVVYESRLELARLIFADFDRAVHRILAQPGDVHEIAVAYPSVAWVPPVPSALTPGTARACPQVPPGQAGVALAAAAGPVWLNAPTPTLARTTTTAAAPRTLGLTCIARSRFLFTLEIFKGLSRTQIRTWPSTGWCR